MQYVDTSDNKRYVLRTYNNGFNKPRVRFEHAILEQLKSKQLSFKIPTTIPSLLTKESYVTLSDGAEASMFDLIEGELPKLTRVKQIGSSSGELSAALGEIVINQTSPTAPYYDLYAVHHAITREIFFQEMALPVFDRCREAADKLVKDILELEDRLESFQTLNLPKQLIHGDLHYDNILCDGEKVSGLLDFEFCAYDFRAMELAICLSKYAGEKEAMGYFVEFVSGFAEKGMYINIYRCVCILFCIL